MKHIIYIYISQFAFISSICAQNYYSRMYDFFQVWESAANPISYNASTGDLTITGTAQDFFTTDTLIYGAVFSALLHENGTYQTKVLIANDSIRYYTHVGLQANKFLMLKSNDLRTFIGADRKIKYEIVYFDSLGDTLSKIAVLPNQDKFDGINMIQYSKKVIILGRDITQSSSTTAPLAILCIDTTGRQLWYKTYPGKRRYTNSVELDKDGNFILAGSTYKGDGITDTVSGWYAKMDTSGNFIWEKSLEPNTPYYKTYVWVNKSDSGYYLSGGNDGSFIYSAVRDTSFSYLIKFSSQTGSINWEKRFFTSKYGLDCGFGKMTYKNNHFYGTIDYETNDGWNNFSQYIQFVKVDLEGNLKWKRLFSQWYKDNRAFSLTAVPDGFIICADGKDTTHTTGFTDAWIIKTDTNGCIIPGCHLQDGLVQITNPEAFVKVYPNPATDKITVQITDSRAQLKSYFIYGSKGNFISQQPLQNHAAEIEIRTAQLPEGMYYLVLELKGGERAVRKIMVQR